MTLALPQGVTLYFSRHGQTQANVEKRFSGRKDTPLTALGLNQAAAIGHVLKREVGPHPPLDFVASPLARAQTTMRIVRRELDLPETGFVTDARLEEIDLGLWDQLTDEQARALDPALFDARMADKWHVPVPGGENYEQVAARISAWVGDLKADTFAVSHGATIRILRGLFAGLDWKGMNDLDEPQGVVFRAKGDRVAKLEP